MKKYFALIALGALLLAGSCGRNKDQAQQLDSDSVKIADLTSEYK